MQGNSVNGIQLAEHVAKAGQRVLQALKAENRPERPRDGARPHESRGAQLDIQKAGQDYLKAMRQYVQFFNGIAAEAAVLRSRITSVK